MVTLYDAAEVTCEVVDVEGKPVAGAAVIATQDVFGHRASGEEPNAVTDARGVARLTAVAFGRTSFRAFAPGFRVAETEMWLRRPTAVKLVLEPAAGVSFAVRVEGMPITLERGKTRTVRLVVVPR